MLSHLDLGGVVSLKDGWIVFTDDCALGLKGESLWDGSWSVESP